MIVAIIGIAYLSIGIILSGVLLRYIEKKLGEGTLIGSLLIAYINVVIWPFFFPMMIRQTKIEAKRNDDVEPKRELH